MARPSDAGLGARSVTFLIADLSGRALVRLTRVDTAEPGTGQGADEDDAARSDGGERAVSEPLDRDAGARALRSQSVRVLRSGAANSPWRTPPPTCWGRIL